jgi:serine/threonine-protein kinase
MDDESTDPPGTLAFGSASTSAGGDEHRASVARARVVLGVVASLWVLCGLLDWVVVALGHAGNLALLLSLRTVSAACFVAVLARLSVTPLPSPRALAALDTFAYTAATVTLSLMCVGYGGLASPYAHGVTFLLVARGVADATPWKQGLVLLGVPALSHPVVMLAAAAWSPEVRMQLGDGHALAAFAQDLVFVAMTTVALIVSKHFVWTMRVQLRAARRVGRYQLKRELGRGGMGAVWLAHDRSLRRDVALKILRPDVAASPGMIERFEREVRATAELSHPNIVRVFDGGVTGDGLWFFAMEPLEGETLWAILGREKALPIGRAVGLMRQAAHALAEAHARGIVHRDVKPENLFVCPGAPEQLKLLDFGIARLLERDDGPALTGAGWVVGTPTFMSPEQASGVAATPASDVYSLGAVLYASLTGRPPIEPPTPSAVLLSHAVEPILPPSLRVPAHLPALPAELERIVMRCLAKRATDRYATAAELAAELDAVELPPDQGAPTAPSMPDASEHETTRQLAIGA